MQIANLTNAVSQQAVQTRIFDMEKTAVGGLSMGLKFCGCGFFCVLAENLGEF